MITNSVKLLFLMIFVLMMHNTVANAETVEMQLSNDKISLGDTLTITYNINSTSHSSPDFSPLEKDFRIVGTYYGNTINMINGVTKAQTYWLVTIEPKSVGELWIPEIRFDQTKSVARKIWVVEASNTMTNHTHNASAFVKAEVNNPSPYVQSQVLYTFKLYYNSPLENSMLELPHIKDALLVPVGTETTYQTTIKGAHFNVLEKHFALFPQKAGKILIPSTRFRATEIEINSTIMNDLFLNSANKSLQLSTSPLALEVKNIPERYQNKIWLPAQSIAITEKWSSDPTHWEKGNPITRTIMVEAQGLRADQIPDLTIDNISGVNIYADTPQRSNSARGNLVIGTWQQKVTYIPNQAQTFTIPALTLNWWDTKTNKNAIAQLKSIPVNVQEKVLSTSSLPANLTKKSNMSAPDMALPSLKLPMKARNQSLPFYFSIWFWISIILFFVWLNTLWWMWKKNKKSIRSTSIEKINPNDTQHDLFNAKLFAQACKQNNREQAKKYLLLWSQTQWQDPPRSLGTLCEMIEDINLKKAIAHLEQALYADKTTSWHGRDLLAAFQQIKKSKKFYLFSMKNNSRSADPLPPLNP